MAQEAFLRAFRALGGWHKESAFSTWLFALATNLYRSQLRRMPPVPVPLESVAEPGEPVSTGEELERRDRDRSVRAAVLSLPPKYRDALVLFYFHGMDISAAARSLELPEGTVKARLSRGRAMLKSKLETMLDIGSKCQEV